MAIESLSPLIMTDEEARRETVLDMRDEFTSFAALRLEELLERFDRDIERDETNEV